MVRLRRGAIDPPRQVNHRVPAAARSDRHEGDGPAARRPISLGPRSGPGCRALAGRRAGVGEARIRSSSEPGAGCDATGRPWPQSPRPWSPPRPASPPCWSSRPKPTRSSSRLTSTWPSRIVQTQAANRALELANARERARFDLALEAIKTFHGQVSEDLLLKEKQFDGLRTKMLHERDRLLSAAGGAAQGAGRPAFAGGAWSGVSRRRRVDGQDRLASRCAGRAQAGSRAATGPGRRGRARMNRRSANAGDSLIAVGDVAGGDRRSHTAHWRRMHRPRPSRAARQIESRRTADSAAVREMSPRHRQGRSTTAATPPRHSLRTSRLLHCGASSPSANPDVTQFQSDLAQSYHDIGEIHRASGRAAEALDGIRAGACDQPKLTEADPRPLNSRAIWPRATSISAACIKRRAIFAAALASRSSRPGRSRRSLPTPTPRSADSRVIWPRAIRASARSRTTTGRFEDAVESFETARTILQKLADANPTLTVFQNRLAMSHSLCWASVPARRPTRRGGAPSFKRPSPSWSGSQKLQPSAYDLYNLACFHSLLSGIAAEPGSGLTDSRRPQPRRTGRGDPAPGRRRGLAGRRASYARTPTSIRCGRARTFRFC